MKSSINQSQKENDGDEALENLRRRRRRGEDDFDEDVGEGNEEGAERVERVGVKSSRGKSALTTEKALATFLSSHAKTDADREHERAMAVTKEKNAHEFNMANVAAQAQQMAMFAKLLEARK